MYDARVLQARYPSVSAFYKKFGFCLLHSPTKVKNWNENYLNPFTDINKIYKQECTDMLKQIYPENDEHEIHHTVMFNAVLRRGPGSKNNFYAEGVHQDYGLSDKEYRQSLDAYGGKYMTEPFDKHWSKDVIKGMKGIVFWRPILNQKPLKHLPLTVLDRNTVKM